MGEAERGHAADEKPVEFEQHVARRRQQQAEAEQDGALAQRIEAEHDDAGAFPHRRPWLFELHPLIGEVRCGEQGAGDEEDLGAVGA